MDPTNPALVAAARELLAQLAEQKPAQGPTMGELYDAYWLCEGKRLKTARHVDFAWRLLNAVTGKDGKTLGQRESMSITAEIVEEIRDGLAVSPFTGRELEPGTRNRNLYLIHRILNWSARNRKIPYVPIAPIRIEAEHNRRQTCIRTDDEFSRLMSHIKHETLRVFVLVLFDSGMRFGEAIQIRRSQVTRRPGAGGVVSLTEEQTKTNRARKVYLTKRACDAIDSLPDYGPFVFSREDGEHYGYVYFRKLLEEAVDRARIPSPPGQSIRFHQFRHAFVNRAQSIFRWSQPRIMKQTGHTTVCSYLRYGDADDDEMRELMEEMDAFHDSRRLGPQSKREEIPQQIPQRATLAK